MSQEENVATFVDRVVLHATAGNGGHGVASVHREKFKPLGGPDGGNGGKGGSVILVVDAQMTTLLDYHHSPHRKAANGGQGAGDMRNGASADDLRLGVPSGTIVLNAEGEVLADLVGEGAEYVVARGGRGEPARRRLCRCRPVPCRLHLPRLGRHRGLSRGRGSAGGGPLHPGAGFGAEPASAPQQPRPPRRTRPPPPGQA